MVRGISRVRFRFIVGNHGLNGVVSSGLKFTTKMEHSGKKLIKKIHDAKYLHVIKPVVLIRAMVLLKLLVFLFRVLEEL